jgi:uncharacterized protein YciI
MTAMHWLLQYRYVDDILERRTPHRSEHLALAQAAAERGELLLAGAAGDPPDRAVFLWVGDDPSAAQAFVTADPYQGAGLVTSWELQPINLVVGGDQV